MRFTLDGLDERITIGQGKPGRWQLLLFVNNLRDETAVAWLRELEAEGSAFSGLNCDIVAVTPEPQDTAKALAEELGLQMAVAFGMPKKLTSAWGLYVEQSTSKDASAMPAVAPAVMAFDACGVLQLVSLSSAPGLFCSVHGLVKAVEAAQKVAEEAKAAAAAKKAAKKEAKGTAGEEPKPAGEQEEEAAAGETAAEASAERAAEASAAAGESGTPTSAAAAAPKGTEGAVELKPDPVLSSGPPTVAQEA